MARQKRLNIPGAIYHVLGDGAFVEQILEDVDEMMRKQEKLKNNGWDLERLDELCV